jgi:hypothetical protein
MSTPKDHHLLPAFYLRGFCNKDLHAKENHEKDPSRCRVWIYDRTQNRCRVRGVKNVAVKRHFYSADTPEGGRDPTPERMLSVLEGKAASIVKSLYPERDLSTPEKGSLARFAAVMMSRTPSFRLGQLSFADRHAQKIKEQMFPTVDALRAFLRSKDVPVDEMPGMVEQEFHDLHDESRKLPVDKNYTLRRIFELGEKVGAVLAEFDWTFAWADPRTSFVTSDVPFMLLDNDGETVDPFTGHVGVKSPGTTKMLPLTQDVCLLIGDDAPSIRHERLDRKTVHDLNFKQSLRYDRWLIARDEALLHSVIKLA